MNDTITNDWTWLFLGSLFIAIVFAWIRPTLDKPKTTFDYLKNIGLIYCQSLCWGLISCYCLIRQINHKPLFPLGDVLIIVGLALYFLFVGLYIFNRFSRTRKN